MTTLVVCTSLSCAEPVNREQSVDVVAQGLNFDAGDVLGTVSWNGSVVGGLEAQGLFAYAQDAGGAWLNSAYLFSNGTYLLPNVVPGDHTVYLDQNGCGQAAGLLGQRPVTVQAAATANGDFDITTTAGRVLGSITVNGVPAAHPRISLEGLCGDFGSDGSGAFGHYLPPGSYHASVRVNDALFGTFDFDVAAGMTTNVGAVDFRGGAIAGSVSWNGAAVDGLAAQGLFAYALDAAGEWLNRAYLSPDGAYVLPSVVPGDHTLYLDQNGCGQAAGLLGQRPVTVQAAATANGDFDITTTAGRVLGSITVNGVPAAHPRISLEGLCGDFGSDGSGAFGHYLPPGSYHASVRVNDALLGTFDFDVAAGTTTNVGAVDFRGGAIAGSVSWNGAAVDGLAAQGLFAYALDAAGGWLNWAYLSPDGAYVLPSVVPGDHTLYLDQNGCGQAAGLLGQRPVTVQAAATANGDFDITTTAGRVLGSITVNGVPAAYPRISLEGLCGDFGSDAAGIFGHYLPPGTYHASVRVTGSLVGTFDFTVLAAQTTDVDIGTTPSGAQVTVDLSGGIDEIGGISLTFAEVLTGGQTTVVESGAGPPPDTGFRIVGLSGQPRYWDIDTTATYVPPILVCIHYDSSDVQGNEANLSLRHDGGSGWEDITTSIDTGRDIICGLADSLSPFAVFEPAHANSDADGDGVEDTSDACQQTAANAVVDSAGCSVDDRCPCAGAWENHGAYVSCVASAADGLRAEGRMSGRERGAVVSAAARSRCGT